MEQAPQLASRIGIGMGGERTRMEQRGVEQADMIAAGVDGWGTESLAEQAYRILERLVVTLENLDTEPRFALSSSGPMLRVPPKFLELHSGNKPEEPIDAHSVQPYYTLLLAREANMTISIHATPEEIVLSAA